MKLCKLLTSKLRKIFFDRIIKLNFTVAQLTDDIKKNLSKAYIFQKIDSDLTLKKNYDFTSFKIKPNSTETQIEKGLILNIKSVMQMLGPNWCFAGSQIHIPLGDKKTHTDMT